jgi:hypothetical protein
MFHGGNSTYCTSETAIISLINDYNWQFSGTAGKDCSGLGIDDNKLNLSLNIYPNPSKNILNIKSNNLLERITLIDINGKVIMEIKAKDIEIQHYISVAALENGLYFINAYSNNGSVTMKLIKE